MNESGGKAGRGNEMKNKIVRCFLYLLMIALAIEFVRAVLLVIKTHEMGNQIEEMKTNGTGGTNQISN